MTECKKLSWDFSSAGHSPPARLLADVSSPCTTEAIPGELLLQVERAARGLAVAILGGPISARTRRTR